MKVRFYNAVDIVHAFCQWHHKRREEYVLHNYLQSFCFGILLSKLMVLFCAADINEMNCVQTLHKLSHLQLKYLTKQN